MNVKPIFPACFILLWVLGVSAPPNVWAQDVDDVSRQLQQARRATQDALIRLPRASETGITTRQMFDTLFSEDVEAATEAVSFFASLQALTVLYGALDHPYMEVRTASVNRIAEIGDETSVLPLHNALQNSIPAVRGGEEHMLQLSYRNALVAALSRLTGLDFEDKDVRNFRHLQDIDREIAEWFQRRTSVH